MRHLAEVHGHPLTDASRVVSAIGLIVESVPEHVVEGIPELDRPLQELRDIVRVMDVMLEHRAQETVDQSEVAHAQP
jgi:hypothetical protein